MTPPVFDGFGGEGDKLSQRLTRSLASPFGVWSTSENRTAVIAMLSVYGVIFLAGLIGHVCVTAYTTASRKKYHNCRRGALLILANLSSSQMVFLLCCLPSIAYKSIMNLSYGPWILSDVVCRMVPFMELFILGVTVLSFCVLSLDRFRSAGQNTKAYEEAGDSCLTGICKLIVIWVGAMILASPEVFVYGTNTYQQKIPQKIFQKLTKLDPMILDGTLPQYKRLDNPKENLKDLAEFLENFELNIAQEDDDFAVSNVTTFAVTYQYQKCEPRVSLWPDAPAFLVTFIETYNNIRLWWLFGFYFCLPVFFSLLFAMLVALRLSRVHNKCIKEHGQYPVDGTVGTLNSHRGGSLNRSNSVASNQTLSSEAQQLMAAQNGGQGTPYNGSLRHNQPITHRSASPANSYPGGVMTPMIVRACNTPLSPLEPGNGYLHSPVTSPSMTSQMYDVNGHGKTSSLPPHGRGSRGKGRMQKIILFNIARDRALNTLLVALILAFSLTWLPQHIFHILFAKTQLQDALDTRYVILILDICRYLSAFSFAVNPIVMYLSYKPYRIFMDRFCCSCRCCCKC